LSTGVRLGENVTSTSTQSTCDHTYTHMYACLPQPFIHPNTAHTHTYKYAHAETKLTSVLHKCGPGVGNIRNGMQE